MANEPLSDSHRAGRVIHGYRPTDVRCPYCHDRHGMLETTDEPGVVLYRCWCGATAKGRDDVG